MGFPWFKLSLAEHVPHDLLRRVVSQEGRQKEQLYLRDCVEQTRYFTEYVHDSLHFVGVLLGLVIHREGNPSHHTIILWDIVFMAFWSCIKEKWPEYSPFE